MQPLSSKYVPQAWRFYSLWFLLCVSVMGILWRLIDLNVLDRCFLLKQSKARILRNVSIPAYRGMITDRLGVPLAISTPVDSLWIDPQLFQPTPIQLNKLAYFLRLSPSFIRKQAKKRENRQFVYLKRGNPPFIAKAVLALHIPGVFFKREYKRYYPEGEVTAHVIGLTNIDDQGQEGLELAYNQWLAGTPGQDAVVKDRLGHVIPNVALLKQPLQGHDLILSIDHRIQYLAYRALKETVSNYHAASGSAVVLDVKTGEILAMVNQPSYNPNSRPNNHDGRYRNRAVTDMFEPGSVIKPFTIAFALESGEYTQDTKIDTNPGWMKIGGYRISDTDLNHGIITLTQLLQYSSNIAAAKILLSLKPDHYYALLRAFGFGERTTSGFPGESMGTLISYNTWIPSVVATLSFGYGLAVTTLQLAQGYAILEAGGIKRPVSFVKVDQPSSAGGGGVRILPKKVATTVVKMLETVTQKGGTGALGGVYHYRIAGKTGTAYISGPNGYDKHHYMSSFVGMASVNNPQLVVAVVIRDPREKHFGGVVAAPLFSKIMSGALRLLNISPDNS
ncbi:peptidoglycan D,D-transpeptidase FtsI family protein [Coxiella endosymbiont of Amblyomma nuttalli]|uniref:peptidoglycan D,D-transpeptidase FtsI family protein n=1 Tax=Coxiella endosymbiont of Amblyomma nuttalli TaxID=2749996 RepID=UPI001BAC5D9D|nr:penicillin-binding protein 2 [Coxiella endosymbiont of Amblyomma nuttalli]